MDIYRIKNSLQEGRTIFDLPLRVAFYARVSTEKDCQLHSFDNQLSFFAGYITAQKKWSLYRPQVTLLCSYSDTIPNVEKKMLTHYTLYNKILLISSPWNVVI